MSEEAQLDAFESAVTRINDVIKLLEDIKKIHSKVDEKSEETLSKLASVDEKIAEIRSIRDELNNAINNINDVFKALKDENATFKQQLVQLENRVSKIETVPMPIIEASKTSVSIEKKNSTQSVISSESSALYQFFASRGWEVIDKRQNGGSLWVVGEKNQLQPVIDEAKKEFDNLSFEYLAKGGKSTKQRASWYTKDKR